MVASLKAEESNEAVHQLSEEHPHTEFVSAWGNLFVPHHLADLSRRELLASKANRKALRDALYADFQDAYHDNHLVKLILEHKPEIIIDSVNTATGISYQDVFDGAKRLIEDLEGGDARGEADAR